MTFVKHGGSDDGDSQAPGLLGSAGLEAPELEDELEFDADCSSPASGAVRLPTVWPLVTGFRAVVDPELEEGLEDGRGGGSAVVLDANGAEMEGGIASNGWEEGGWGGADFWVGDVVLPVWTV